MSKNSKKKKQLLNKFRDYSNEELMAILKKAITEHTILVKSGEKAAEILAKYDLSFCFSYQDNHIIQYIQLILQARGIQIPDEWYMVEPTYQDIISRIDEERLLDTRWVINHDYLYDAYYDTNEKDYNTLSSSEKVFQLNALYDRIIASEFPKTQEEAPKR